MSIKMKLTSNLKTYNGLTIYKGLTIHIFLVDTDTDTGECLTFFRVQHKKGQDKKSMPIYAMLGDIEMVERDTSLEGN